MSYMSGRQIGLLVKSGHNWRTAGGGEAEAVAAQRRQCIDVVVEGLADVVFCRVGPAAEPTLVMIYATDSIAQVREMLGQLNKDTPQ